MQPLERHRRVMFVTISSIILVGSCSPLLMLRHCPELMTCVRFVASCESIVFPYSMTFVLCVSSRFDPYIRSTLLIPQVDANKDSIASTLETTRCLSSSVMMLVSRSMLMSAKNAIFDYEEKVRFTSTQSSLFTCHKFVCGKWYIPKKSQNLKFSRRKIQLFHKKNILCIEEK